MEKELANQIVEALARAEVQFQEIDSLVSQIEANERASLVESLGQIAASHSDLLAHVQRQFPELDPEDRGKEFYERAKSLHRSKYS